MQAASLGAHCCNLTCRTATAAQAAHKGLFLPTKLSTRKPSIKGTVSARQGPHALWSPFARLQSSSHIDCDTPADKHTRWVLARAVLCRHPSHAQLPNISRAGRGLQPQALLRVLQRSHTSMTGMSPQRTAAYMEGWLSPLCPETCLHARASSGYPHNKEPLFQVQVSLAVR